jgi:hypothetical protein
MAYLSAGNSGFGRINFDGSDVFLLQGKAAIDPVPYLHEPIFFMASIIQVRVDCSMCFSCAGSVHELDSGFRRCSSRAIAVESAPQFCCFPVHTVVGKPI